MTDPAPESHGAVATAEPPAKPPAPPATGVAAPEPGRKRGRGGWIIAVVLIVVVVLGLAGVVWWAMARRAPAPSDSASGASAFDSAMTKAMVKAPAAPATPVELSTVEARGTHSFVATFTPEEVSALINAFPHPVTVSNTEVSLSDVAIAITPKGGLRLTGTVTSGDTAYSGTVSGEVAYVNGQVVATGPLRVQAEGFSLPSSQAQVATDLLLAYVNGYLAAAPGLTITEASVSADGIQVRGLAPDTIEY